jgi:hypothetical protein
MSPGPRPRAAPDDSWTIRRAGPGDSEFLTDMLVEAVHWPPARNHSREQILAFPDFALYVTGWPRDGDLGVLAEAAGQRGVGAAWLRFFALDDPGYGFVSPDVPELAISVVASAGGEA